MQRRAAEAMTGLPVLIVFVKSSHADAWCLSGERAVRSCGHGHVRCRHVTQ
eukprot:NODE_34678_length_255_cov_12.296875.p1 GENE.NODE_34678_length_255_cov_12.296875~~NODE_34678_length_255_cov_12.296875.p1  ORF type:complete len:51 (+),score=0.04 NODE_34678_length_255_cov_12.296875:21-173(+)